MVGGASLCLLGVALVTPGIELPRCVFKTLTGLPCPSCGVTRAVIALSRGQLGQGLFMNPLAAIACGAALLYFVYAAAVLALRLPRLRPVLTPAGGRALRVATVAAIAINWVWLIATGR